MFYPIFLKFHRMYFSFSFKSSVLLIFFIHGIIFSMLLLFQGFKNEYKSNFWLAAFILLCSFYIAPFMFGYAGWYSKEYYRNILFYWPFQQLFLIPPLLFFYIKSLLVSNFRFQRKDWIHFIPSILYILYIFSIWVADRFIFDAYYFYDNGRDKDLDLWYQVTGFIWLLFYLFKSLSLYKTYKKNTYEVVSFADSILFSWVQRFLIAFLLLLLLRILFFILNPEWANFGNKFWYYLSFSILFYYIALSGYIHSIKINFPFANTINSLPLLYQEASKESVLQKEDFKAASNNYDASLKVQLEELMSTEQLFKNPKLTLFDIAHKLDTHPKKISKVINQGFEMNFNDFINNYRIKEVIRVVKSKPDHLKTFLGIALDAGFNSKSTFNRAFKKQTQQTPKEFFKEK